MPAELHETSLIALLAIGFVLALLFGLAANVLRVSPIVGYLLAGIAVGPFTPGFVGDTGLASQLAEIGVILLMFGVGLHFSIKDLMSVRAIALPGAVAQIVTATAIGAGMAHLLGWSLGAGLVFGLSLSVASTVVLLRALEERNALQSSEGKIAVGWLIVEDLAMVLALVMLPALAGVLGGDASAAHAPGTTGNTVAGACCITLAKVALFVALALVVGTRVVPWLLMQVTRTGSRELFTLCVLAIALGIAYGSSAAFGVSFALGAFFAGVILSESELSHQAGNDSLPLKDAFAVLFFVSVGMLFDPTVLVREPLAVLAVLAIIMVGKSLAAFVIVLAVPASGAHRAHGFRAAWRKSASSPSSSPGLGGALGLLPPDGRDLILAGAILSIALNPVTFAGIAPLTRWIEARPRLLATARAPGRRAASHAGVAAPRDLRDHAILVGYGRVGGAIGPVLKAQGLPFAVIERDHLMLASAQAAGRADHRRRRLRARSARGRGHRTARACWWWRRPTASRRGASSSWRASSSPTSTSWCAPTANASWGARAAQASTASSWANASWRTACWSTRCAALGVPAERARAAAGRDAPVNPEGT